MRWWETPLLLLLAFFSLLLYAWRVPGHDWSEWRTWFRPRTYDPDDSEDERPPEP